MHKLRALVCAVLVFAGFGAAQAATPAQITAAAPGLPGPLRLVATRMAVGEASGANKYSESMTVHVAGSNISQIGAAFANWSYSAASESSDSSQGTVKAYIGYNGKCAPLTFNGSFTGVLPGGGTLFSDVVSLPFIIPAGATFYTFEWRNVPSGGISYRQEQNTTTGLGDRLTLSSSALSDTRCATPSQTVGGTSKPPVAIYGPGTNPSVVVVGDSIAVGVKDTPDIDYHSGFTSIYVLPSTTVSLNLGSSGLKAQDYQNNPSYVANRVKLLKFASTAISEIGTNDVHLGGGTSAAETGLSYVYNLFPQNAKIVQTTISAEPGDSTDNYTTTGAQSADTSVDAINADIKSSTPPATLARRNDWFDSAALLTPGDKWPVGRTVTDAGTTASSTTLTSTSQAQFQSVSTVNGTASDLKCAVAVTGAGGSGGLYTGIIASVSNLTTAALASSAATTTSATTLIFANTNDGIHPCPWGYKLVEPQRATFATKLR